MFLSYATTTQCSKNVWYILASSPPAIYHIIHLQSDVALIHIVYAASELRTCHLFYLSLNPSAPQTHLVRLYERGAVVVAVRHHALVAQLLGVGARAADLLAGLAQHRSRLLLDGLAPCCSRCRPCRLYYLMNKYIIHDTDTINKIQPPGTNEK